MNNKVNYRLLVACL